AAEMRGDLKRVRRAIESGKSSAVAVADESSAVRARESGFTPATAAGSSGRTRVASGPSVAVSGGGSGGGEKRREVSRKFLWIGVAVAVIVASVAGVFFFSRRATALTEKDSILLTDFVNTTGDPVFDGTLKQALALQLEQSPYLNIVPQSKI